MNSMILDRHLLAHVVIAMACCVGARMILVQPRVAEIATTEAAIRYAREAAPTVSPGSIRKIADQASAMRGQVAELQRRSDIARDSSGLYRDLTALARQHRVTMLSLNPGVTTPSPTDKTVGVTTLEMVMQGEYERVARFLDTVDGLGGYVRSASLTLSPLEIDGQQLIGAHYICEVLSFSLPDALASWLGGPHDAQH